MITSLTTEFDAVRTRFFTPVAKNVGSKRLLELVGISTFYGLSKKKQLVKCESKPRTEASNVEYLVPLNDNNLNLHLY